MCIHVATFYSWGKASPLLIVVGAFYGTVLVPEIVNSRREGLGSVSV